MGIIKVFWICSPHRSLYHRQRLPPCATTSLPSCKHLLLQQGSRRLGFPPGCGDSHLVNPWFLGDTELPWVPAGWLWSLLCPLQGDCGTGDALPVL